MISIHTIREMIRSFVTDDEDSVEDDDAGDESKSFSVTGNYRK